MHIPVVRIVMITDSRIIGLMLSGGDFFFPGFVMVLGCLYLILQVVLQFQLFD